jgi:hypothetical protein
VVDTETHDWGRPGLDIIKGMAAKVMDRIRERNQPEPRDPYGTENPLQG